MSIKLCTATFRQTQSGLAADPGDNEALLDDTLNILKPGVAQHELEVCLDGYIDLRATS